MDKEIVLSVIIVNWNARDFLLACLKSLHGELQQIAGEIIVVDNASTDGSVTAVKESFPSVEIVCNQINAGFAAGNNTGIRRSRGKYLALINPDVIVKENCLGRLLGHMENDAGIGVSGPRILSPGGTYQRSCMGFPTVWNSFTRALALDAFFPGSRLFGTHLMTYWHHDITRQVDVINGCFWMVRKSALESVGLLDEDFFMYGEDIDWCKRFHKAGWKVMFFPEAEAVHYGAASASQMYIRSYVQMQKAALQYWRKHHSRPAQLAFLLSLWIFHCLRVAGHSVQYLIHRGECPETGWKVKRSIEVLRWMRQAQGACLSGALR